MFRSRHIRSTCTLLVSLVIGLWAQLALAEPFKILEVEGPEIIKPFESYDVTIHFTETTPADQFHPFAYLLVSLKDPSNQWMAYTKKRAITRTGAGFTSKVFTLDVGAVPACTGCVWEARALTSSDAAEESIIDIGWQEDITIYQSDEVTDVRLEATAVAPSGFLEIEIDYSASVERDIRVEVISGDSSAYSGVVHTVGAGAGTLTVDLPISEALSPEDLPYVSVKIVPKGGDWSEYFNQVNTAVNTVVVGGPYYWAYVLEDVEHTVLSGPSPSAGIRVGKVGSSDQGIFTDDSLPFQGIQSIVIYSSVGPFADGHVLDLMTGEILEFALNTSLPKEHESYFASTVILPFMVAEYEEALNEMIQVTDKLVNGFVPWDVRPEFQQTLDYLNAIKTEF